MQNLSFFIILGCFPFLCFGSINTDSLIQVLPQLEGIEKVDALNELSRELRYSRSEEAMNYANQSLVLAQKINYVLGEGEANLRLGILHTLKADYVNSDEYANKAIKNFQTVKNASGIAKSWNTLGMNERERGNYNSALSFFNKAKELSETLSDTVGVSKLEANIGAVFFYKGDYKNALSSYLKLINLAKQSNDKALWANALSNAAMVYSFQDEFQKALELYFEAYNLNDEIDNLYLKGNNLSGMGTIFKRLEMHDEAIEHINKAIEIYEIAGHKKQLSSAINNLGWVYFDLEDYSKAMEYYTKAYELKKEAGIVNTGMVKNNIASVYLKEGKYNEALQLLKSALENDSIQNRSYNLGMHYTRLGELFFEQQALKKAKGYFLKAFDTWKDGRQLTELATTSKALSAIYEKEENFKEALKYQTIYKNSQDSIFNQKQQNELTRLLIEQQRKQKDIELKQAGKDILQAKEKLRTQNILWTLIVFSTLLVSSWWWFKKFRLRSEKSKLQSDILEKQSTINEITQVQKDMESTIEKKNLEIAFLSLNSIQKDDFIRQFTKNIQLFTEKYPDNTEAQKMLRVLHIQNVNNQGWEHFKNAFEQLYPSFFENLFKRFPTLTNKEIRYCALTKMHIPLEDIALILGVSSSAVHKARYRLRKKFTLQRTQTLEHFLSSIQ